MGLVEVLFGLIILLMMLPEDIERCVDLEDNWIDLVLFLGKCLVEGLFVLNLIISFRSAFNFEDIFITADEYY